ncbi:MAG: hypothetical protein KGI04_04550 [Candidatus Micrarchaeota archaeon]|nr:hypothetical protein [Candidatus Micrarchaeota archaeon]
MSRLLTAFVVSLFLAMAVAGAQTQINNPTIAYANETVSNAAYYLSQVNESGYLIFYPNLTQAYSDLFKAESTYNTSPSSAVVFANKAVDEANTEYQRISTYRSESAVVMVAFTIFFVLLLGRVARPVKKSKVAK